MSARAVRAAVEQTRAGMRERLIRDLAAEHTTRQAEQYLREVAR